MRNLAISTADALNAWISSKVLVDVITFEVWGGNVFAEFLSTKRIILHTYNP
jgi:hypothetical protein